MEKNRKKINLPNKGNCQSIVSKHEMNEIDELEKADAITLEEQSNDDLKQTEEFAEKLAPATVLETKPAIEEPAFNLSTFDVVTPTRAAYTRANYMLTVVNHKCGKRSKVNKEILRQLGTPEFIQILIDRNQKCVAIVPSEESDPSACRLKTEGKAEFPCLIYSADLVKELTELFEFNFDNRSSNGLENVRYVEQSNKNIAIIY